MTYRSLLAAVALTALAACTSETEPAVTPEAPTAPAAPRASAAPAPTISAIDTTEASSVCKAVVRQRGTAFAKLDGEAPTADQRAQVTALDEMAADVCR
jgi:hypothetical protein